MKHCDRAVKLYTSVNRLLKHLTDIYEDQNVKLTMCNTYKNLWIKITEFFMTFYLNFTWIISVLLYNEHTLINDLKNRLICCLQNTLTLYETEFKDVISLKTYLQWTDKTQHSLYLQWQNDWKNSLFSISSSKFKNFINMSWMITTLCLSLSVVSAVSVIWLNFFLWVITNITAVEHEQL